SAGSQSEALVISNDFFPTFLEIAGIENNISENIDGISFIPSLKNPDKENHHTLFWHYPHYHAGSGMLPAGAVRSGKWKLIEWYEKSLLKDKEPAFELYDLENDPGESSNLAGKLKSKTEAMAGELKRWREDIKAQMPEVNKGFENQY
ncbi:MAG: sulfatase/phosphatase domain-containing protein, partial [Bacteroidota bacterium]